MISYDPLWKTLERKKVTRYALITKYGVGNNTITRMKRNEHVTTHTLEVFCKILSCKVSDIIVYIPDKDPHQEEPPTP